jgi:hypothetical protein
VAESKDRRWRGLYRFFGLQASPMLVFGSLVSQPAAIVGAGFETLLLQARKKAASQGRF